MASDASDPLIQELRRKMIGSLVARGYVRTPKVEEAFRTVHRHLFLPDVPLHQVYSGEAIVTRYGSDGNPISSSSEPAIMGVMVEQLRLQSGHRVLEIGAGTGYNAAILAHLVGPQGTVTTVEIDEAIAETARRNLTRAGFAQVRVRAADGWLGDASGAPYDRIEATVGVWDLSPVWIAQLVEGGIVVVPLWLRRGLQASVAFQKRGDRLRSISVEAAGFMRLRGPHAGPEHYVRVHEWLGAFDEVSPENIAILSELLATTPRIEPAPILPQGWFRRLVLEVPNAIGFAHQGNWRHVIVGIFDPGQRSLAVVEGSLSDAEETRILVFGSETALRPLRESIVSSRPFVLENVQITAIPSAQSFQEDGTLVICRPSFQFAISD